MKESILDVLLYLFEHYFADDVDLVHDRDSLQAGPLSKELAGAGFSPAEINKAFDWLDALAQQRPAATVPRADAPVRIYHASWSSTARWRSTRTSSTSTTSSGSC
jgi:Smg protein